MSTPAGVIGEDDIPSSATRFRRLSHVEWERTTADLFNVTTGAIFDEISAAAADFRADPIQGGYIFEGNGEALEVDSTLWIAYQRTAADLASAVVSDSSTFSRLVPDANTDEERAREFVTRFGARAHRRPLTEAQIDEYMELYETGTTSYLDDSGLEAGVRLVIEAFLQSPYFLYRVESSDEVKDGVVPLDDFERASRLSYFFWGTMPDLELFQAANRGDLSSVASVREQAERLVDDPRARDTVVRFFEKVLEVERYETISPNPILFPDVSESLSDSAHEETVRFLESEMYENSGSLRDLLTSTTTFVDDDLAQIYGLSGTFDDGFEEVELDDSQRSGILTQVGFLAANATTAQPDPIHRGVFIAKRINCMKIAAPPDDVPPLPEPDGQSNRQLVAEHTEMGTCQNCHQTIINPFGFAYEHYDAVGAFRTEDRGHDVDASVEVIVGNGTAQVDDALGLAQALAESSRVHDCMSGHLIAFAQGRNTTERDDALIDRLGAASLDDAVPFRDLMIEMSVAISFLNRATEVE